MKKLFSIYLLLVLTACNGFHAMNFDMTPIGSAPTFNDPYLIVDRAQILIQGNANDKTARITVRHLPIASLLVSKALAYNGATAPSATISAITYNNPATAVGFALNVSNLIAGSFTGDTLDFGNFSISGLNDNNLRVCPASGEANGGSVKCNHAKIRVYSISGTVDGVFNNDNDGYSIPLLVSGVPVGVGVANAAYVQDFTIVNSKNRLKVNDLTSQVANFPVTMDFSNGGSGSYSATLIVEYVLIKQ